MSSECEYRPLPEAADRRIASIAEGQYGVISRRQAVESGVTSSMIQRRLGRGSWIKVHRGVYRPAGAPITWHQSLLAATLAAGDGALVSHRCAAQLWRLAGATTDIREIIVLRGRGLVLPGVAIHRVRDLPACDATVHEGIPVTSVARTIIDLASVWPEEKVGVALDDALRRKMVSLQWLRWRVGDMTRKGRTGMIAINNLLAARPDVHDSELEKRLLRAMRRRGLPEPAPQCEVRDADGRFVARVDFAYPDIKLALEADGYEWHHGRKRWHRDLRRRNELVRLGWRVIHVTAEDLARRPHAVTQDIANAIRKPLGRAATPERSE